MNALLLAAVLLCSSMAHAAIDGNWTEDFETCSQADEDALGYAADGTCGAGAGLQVWAGRSFYADGTFLFGSCCFPAPNAAANPNASISELAVGQGGVNQGAQQLEFYSDYNTSTHNNPPQYVEGVIFKEWTIDAANLDKTWVFRFASKQGDISTDTTGFSTAHAYVMTLAPFLGFAETNHVTLDTNNGLGQWQEDVEISMYLDGSIDDFDNTTGTAGADGIPDLQGQIFLVGFTNIAAAFSPSAMYYDNLSVSELDTDNDGVSDSADNCTNMHNENQVDADGDGYGNACDPDLNNDGIVNFFDLEIFRSAFFTSDVTADLNVDGIVNSADLGIVRLFFFGLPGPSGLVP